MRSVTVAIPTYNRPNLLAAALKSASQQDYPNLKIVVSDNASEGSDTRYTVERYMRDDPRISYSVRSENLGSNANFLWLLDHADTDFFMWLADDDELKYSDHVTNLVRCFESDNTAVLAFSDVDVIKDIDRSDFDRAILKSRFANCKSDYEYLLAWCRFGGGHPVYGLYKIDYLRTVFLQYGNTEWVYYNEGIFLHNAFLRGGVRFCPDAKF